MPKTTLQDEKGYKFASYRRINKTKQLTLYGRVVDTNDNNNNNNTNTEEINDEENNNNDSKSNNNNNNNDDDFKISDSAIEASLTSLRYGGELLLSDLVYSISSTTDIKLLNIMYSR